MVRITPFEKYGMWNRSFSNFQDCENVVLLYSITVGVSLGDLTRIFLIDNLKLHKNKFFLNRFCSVFFNHLAGLFIAGQRYIGQLVTSAEASINIMTNEFKIVTESIYYRSIYGKICSQSGAPNGNFSENICSEDDLRSRIFGSFVVKFLACLPLLGFSNIYKMA